MQTRNRKLVSAIVVAGGMMAAAGQAAAAEQGGYFGAAVGQSKANLDAGEIDAALASLGLGATTTVNDTDTAVKIYGGYQFNKNLAIEAGYTNFGKFSSQFIITSGGSGTGTGEWKGFSVDISALGILPLGDKFSLFGRAGLSIWSLDFDFTAVGPGGTGTASESESGVSPLLGLGATFNFTPQFGLRAEFERHFSIGKDDTTGTSDIDLVTLGLQFKF